MRVLLTGGGTAGHINPALAIAATVKANDPTAEIAFVGIKGGKEEELVKKEEYHLYFVESMGIRRSLSLSNIKALYLALTSPYSKKTTSILDDFQPDIVIGTGGYACWPIMAAAARRKIPTAVHESNSIPGLAVRQLQKKVDRIWLNFDSTADLLKCREKVVKVGNPLRQGFGTVTKAEARKQLGISDDRFVIFSFGGSGGAENVNGAMISMMRDFSSQDKKILHFHVTGRRDYDNAMNQFRAAGLEQAENCIFFNYVYDMPIRMAAADLMICRAGAMTLSELALMRKASILIPSPYVADNHQFRNAKTLSDIGAAALIEEKDLASGALTEEVRRLSGDPDALRALENAIGEFADPDANRRIWNEIRSMVAARK